MATVSGKLQRALQIGLPGGAGDELATLLGHMSDNTAGQTFSGNNTFSGANTFSGTNTHTGLEKVNRLQADQGTAVAAGDFALSGGFGSTASVSVAAGSNDTRGRITVTSAGTGQGANPTITLTFKDGAFGAAPFAVACRGGGSQNTVPVDVATTTTTLVITLRGTPVAAETYVIDYVVLG